VKRGVFDFVFILTEPDKIAIKDVKSLKENATVRGLQVRNSDQPRVIEGEKKFG
jgi:hypothetical protein